MKLLSKDTEGVLSSSLVCFVEMVLFCVILFYSIIFTLYFITEKGEQWLSDSSSASPSCHLSFVPSVDKSSKRMVTNTPKYIIHKFFLVVCSVCSHYVYKYNVVLYVY